MDFSEKPYLQNHAGGATADSGRADVPNNHFTITGNPVSDMARTPRTPTFQALGNDEPLFQESPLVFDEGQTPDSTTTLSKPWKLAIVDDESDIHSVSRMVLGDLQYKSRPVEILSAYSGKDAMRLLKEQPDIAVLLLDVVMETDHAGLDVVKYVRDELDNQMVRIILRTGQPGLAPENKVVSDYDINDYKEKTELTAQKLITTITAALRAYDDLETIRDLATSKELLEHMVRERTEDLENANRRLQQEMADRLRVLESLRRNQGLLASAQRIAKVGNYEWDPAGDGMAWSDQLYLILHAAPHRSPASFSTLLDRIPADQREAVEQSIRNAIAHGGKFDIEHGILGIDGQSGIVRQQGEMSLDATSGVSRVIGIIQDITEQRATTETMRKLSAAVEQTADSVIITNKQGVIEYVNPAFTVLTGYTAEEAIGRTPALLKSEKQTALYYQRLWKTIMGGNIFSDVLINRKKDGTLFYEVKTITPQKDPSGNITHFISTGKDITERMLIQEQIEHLAHHDALTGLPNRILLVDRLAQAISRSKWHNRHVAVLFLDLDRFKLINDSLGHSFGDRILKTMSGRLLECVRDGDTVARLGGDEFAVVLNDIAERGDVIAIADKILRAMKAPVSLDDRELILTTSIGISFFPEDAEDGQALIKRADVAMYNAKAAGKDQYVFYTPQDEARTATKLSLETSLRRAMEQQEFILHYQPLMDIGSRTIIGMEALLRWRRPDGTIVPPMEFIPILEETGLISPVGKWVMHAACLEARALQDAGFGHLRVAVNISLNQFRQKSFVRETEEMLSLCGLEPRCLELELTEGILIDDVKETAQTLESFHELGIRLSIDDFGTGYSSMHYLRRLPFDSLKIDRSFIQGVPGDSDDCAIVTAITSLAHSMNLDIVAEGIETAQQLTFVSSLGCQTMQGYLCSPPVPAIDFRALLTQGSRPETKGQSGPPPGEIRQ